MEANFATMFEDMRHERSLLLLLSLTDPDILKKSQTYRRRNKYNKKSCPRKNTYKENLKGIPCCIIIRIKYIFCLLNEYISEFK